MSFIVRARVRWFLLVLFEYYLGVFASTTLDHVLIHISLISPSSNSNLNLNLIGY